MNRSSTVAFVAATELGPVVMECPRCYGRGWVEEAWAGLGLDVGRAIGKRRLFACPRCEGMGFLSVRAKGNAMGPHTPKDPSR